MTDLTAALAAYDASFVKDPRPVTALLAAAQVLDLPPDKVFTLLLQQGKLRLGHYKVRGSKGSLHLILERT